MLASFLFSLAALAAPTDLSATQVERELRLTDQKRGRCRGVSAYPSPAELQACDGEALHSYTLVLRRGENAEFEKLLSDLFEPLLLRSTGGYDALAMRVVVLSAEADFARTRAAILGGTSPTKKSWAVLKGEPFRWVQDGPRRADFAERWKVIRDRDCRAYNVRYCRERLDDALKKLMDATSPTQT